MSRPQRMCVCERFRRDINEDIRERSLCNWIYESDFDEARKPACIQRVVRCINTIHHETINECETVRMRYPIRRRSGSTWLDDWMELPVACTLTRPPIHHVPFTSNASLPYLIH